MYAFDPITLPHSNTSFHSFSPLKSCLFSCGLHGFQAKATQWISGFYWLQFVIKNSFCLLLLAKAKRIRVLGSFFDRVPSTLTFQYEYQPSTCGSEYEYSKNGTRVVLKYEYCTRVDSITAIKWHDWLSPTILTQPANCPSLTILTPTNWTAGD